MKKILLILSIVTGTFHAISQSRKDTIKTVTISEKRISLPTSSSQQLNNDITERYRTQTLQRVLEMHSNVFVKNYGIGNISTVSIRGSSAAQTQVLWHGVNINNALTGITDFSALPVAFFDKIDIEYGSSTKNPAMSGSILLADDKPVFNKSKKTSIALGYESLKNYSASIGTSLSSLRVSNRLRINISNAKNEYPFFNSDKYKNDTLTHAQSRQIGVLNDCSVKLNNRNLLEWHVWAQYQQREIPPALFEELSAKQETNATFRTLLQWERSNYQTYTFTTHLGLFFEKYQYQDSLIHLTSNASVANIPFIETFSIRLPYHQQLKFQVLANRSFLTDRKEASLNKAGLMASYSIDQIMKRISLQTSVQKEITDVFTVPFIGSLSINANLPYGFKPYLSASSHYRMPTLNELYYNPGGNINLKPETSRNIEGGIQYNKQLQRQSLNMDIAFFNREVKNWIAWYGSSILTPHNIQKVWSRGIDGILNYEYALSYGRRETPNDSIDIHIIPVYEISQENKSFSAKHRTSNIGHRPSKILFGLLYAYTLSTTKESAIANDYSIGKQIPYVPRYQLKGHIGLRWHALELTYVHTYTGYRFVTTDESQYLKPYFSGNVFASYNIQIKNNTLQVSGRFNNLFNTYYESIAGRMMPGRNFSLGLMWERR